MTTRAQQIAILRKYKEALQHRDRATARYYVDVYRLKFPGCDVARDAKRVAV